MAKKEVIEITKEQIELEKAFKSLAIYGMTRERAGTVSNGIMALFSKLQQKINILEANQTEDPIGYIKSLANFDAEDVDNNLEEDNPSPRPVQKKLKDSLSDKNSLNGLKPI